MKKLLFPVILFSLKGCILKQQIKKNVCMFFNKIWTYDIKQFNSKGFNFKELNLDKKYKRVILLYKKIKFNQINSIIFFKGLYKKIKISIMCTNSTKLSIKSLAFYLHNLHNQKIRLHFLKVFSTISI